MERSGFDLARPRTKERRQGRCSSVVTCLSIVSLVMGLATVSVSLLPPQVASAATAVGIYAGPDVVVGEHDPTVSVPVTLSATPTSAVTVSYATENGTGSAQSSCVNDNTAVYESTSGTLTFAAGDTKPKKVTVTLMNCGVGLSAGFLTFFLNLSSPTNATIYRATTQIDVTGDVAASSTPGLYVMGAVVDKSAGTVNVPVLLGGPSGASESVPVTVSYSTHDGSAIAGTDYTTTKGTLTFPPGETVKNISVPILDRSGSAPNRSFTVSLTSPTNATIAQGTGTVTIGASGAPAVPIPGISAPPDVVVGAVDGYINLPVTLSAPGESVVTVSYAMNDGSGSSQGSCVNDNTAIFEGTNGILTFVPGVTTQVVRVPLLNCGNTQALGFLTFFLDLSSNSAGSAINRAESQIDVTSDVAASSTPGLYVMGAVLDNSAGTVKVPVLLGGPSGASEGIAVTVSYSTHNGSAIAGTDYTATKGTLTFPPGETAQNITVPIIDRSGSAPNRSFTVSLTSPTNATIAQGTGTVTIGASGAPAVPIPGISAPPDVVVGAVDGYINLPVTLSAPGESVVTVSYAMNDGSGSSQGSCVNDNTAIFEGTNGILTFVPGETTQVVRVPLLNCRNTQPLGFLTFFLDLSSATNSTIYKATTQIEVTSDVAASSTPGLYIKGAEVDNSAGSVEVPVLLGGPSGASEGVSVTVSYATHNGSAIAGTDYTTTKGTLTFPPGETTQNITVPIIDRSGSAPTRTFTVSLSSPTNATITVGTGTVTIGASGAAAVAEPRISASPDLVVAAVAGYVNVPITLSAPGESSVTVDYATANGTGSSQNSCVNDNTAIYMGTSYWGISGALALTFTPGVTTQVVRVPLLNCDLESSFTFLLNLSGNSADSTIKDASTTITVTGTETPTITSFTPTSGPVGTAVTIKGTNLEGSTSVTFNGKSASITTDTATQLKVKVPVGATTGTITVTTADGSVKSTDKFKVT
jgi:Calx-beta domain